MASEITHEVLVERVGNLHDRFERHQTDVASEFEDVRDSIKTHVGTTAEHEKQLREIALWRAKIVGIFAVLVPVSGFISAYGIHWLEKGWK